jgi:hypothetical protein
MAAPLYGVSGPTVLPGSSPKMPMPVDLSASSSQSGTQANPLDIFRNASGATGNKTTNKDLPAWLKAIGMKGDAYAGGMLKPEIRYGFAYKNGKIHFADGTSYDAKKTKGPDGKPAYSYTGADGKSATYSPTDDQNAYNKAYKASTSNQSFLDKATNTVKFELDHGKQILSNIKPSQVLFGIDPIGTKIGNAVTGAHATAQVDQLGGALPGRYADYENRTGNATGFAKPLQGVAHVIAGAMGAAGAGHGLGELASHAGSALGTSGGGTGEGLGIFSNGGQAGMQGVGGGNAGALASSGGIGGGAGLGGTTAGNSIGSTFAGGSGSGGSSGSGSNNLLSSLFGNGTGSMGSGAQGFDWGSLLSTALNLYGGYQSAQGASQQRDDLASAANRLSTTLGASAISGPGGANAGILPNGAGGSYSLGDLEGLRGYLNTIGNNAGQTASQMNGLPQNIQDALAGVSNASGVPNAPDTSNYSNGLDSIFGRSMADMNRGSAAPGLAATAFAGAGSQLADASRGFNDVRDQTLSTLRAQAQPFETRAYDTLQNDQFSRGQMGSSGGALQTEAFARGLGEADLTRQLQANQEARTTQQNALGVGTSLANVGSNITGLDDQLLQSAFGRFGSTAQLGSNLAQQRFGNNVLLNQTGYDRSNTNLNNQVTASQLPAALQGSWLNLALQSANGQGALQDQGLQQLQAALGMSSAAANARTGNSSAIANLLGARATSPNSGDIWGQILTGIGSRTGNQSGNGSISDLLSGLFGNKG